jgi:hypothetical protein
MNRTNHRVLVSPCWLLCVALAACDGSKDKGKDEKAPDFAKAFDNTSQTDTKANSKRMKELQEKADREAAQAREDELQKITSVTPPLPADVATACTDAGAAFDEFKTKRMEAAGDEAMLGRWNATKEPDVRKFVENCTTIGKLEIAVCLTNAHRNATLAMFGENATDDFAARCQERWGGGGGGEAKAEAKAPAPTP